MRQRNVKNLEARLAENSSCLVDEPRELRGRWAQVFGNENPIFLEIGCGKGKFILTQALVHPQANFIAVEGQENVILRALEKAEQAGTAEADGKKGLCNLRLFIDYVHDLADYFEEGELSGIFLNFSDPWPKARHYKRRLTYRKRLLNYFQVLQEDGFVAFKTDNDGLFAFTLEEIGALQNQGIVIVEKSHDLHSTDFAAKEITTEYEEKFKEAGKPIHYVKLKKSVL
ncbi:MAG: tRNA (guanosine(46)-N7)-methyltransferase TrmB [Firmicutes bacterium]|nr:tRNA (guanosine(46)-N7)-methyltransferase TrmB [Bacillota bacterium]